MAAPGTVHFRLLALPLLDMLGSPASTAAPSSPSPLLLPGKVCESEGVGTTFFAQSWSNTCECASFPPQQPGDQCNWWTQPCGYCCQTCNASLPGAIKCKSFDNIRMLPVMTVKYGWFGDNATSAIDCLLRGQRVSGSCEPDQSVHQMGCSDLPQGKCTVRFHDTDMYIATHPDDFVTLPPDATMCGDAKEDGFSRPNPRPGTFSSLWWEAGVQFYRKQGAKFFPQLKAAFEAEGKGHSLNGLYQDQELDPTRQSLMKVEPLDTFMPNAGSNLTLKRFCLRARWTAIQRDKRFPAVLQLLRQRGFNAPNDTKEWLADAMLPYSEPQNWAESFEEHDMDRVVWEAVMVERMSLYWHDALFTEANKVFPGIKHANAGRYVWDPKHCPVGAGGTRRCRAGVGATGFNVLNQMLYDSNSALHCGMSSPANRTPSKNCDLGCGGEPGLDLALNKLYNVPLAHNGVAQCWKQEDVPCGGLPRSGFTFLVIHSNLFKGMALAAPLDSVVRPDVSDKSMCPKDPDFLPETGPDDYYQERILHYAVMGADEYIYFGPWDGFVYGTRATIADHELFSLLLKEADAVLGCSGRSWIRDENLRYTDSFVLHGIRTGAHNESNVWRLSPSHSTRDQLAFIQDNHSAGLNVTGVTFDKCTGFASCTASEPQLVNATLQFEDGAVLPSPTTIAPAGVWIIHPSACTWCVRVVWDGGASDWPIPQRVTNH